MAFLAIQDFPTNTNADRRRLRAPLSGRPGIGQLSTVEGMPVSLGQQSATTWASSPTTGFMLPGRRKYGEIDTAFATDEERENEVAKESGGFDYTSLVSGLLKAGSAIGTGLISSYTQKRIAKGASRDQAEREAAAAMNYARAVERGDARGPGVGQYLGYGIAALAVLVVLFLATKGRG